MPIYEYQCLKCQEVIEAWQKFSDDPMTVCPSCEGELKKLISSSSFQLKGSGWYADGYGSKGGGCAKAAGGNGSSNNSGNGSAKETACPAKSGSSCGCS